MKGKTPVDTDTALEKHCSQTVSQSKAGDSESAMPWGVYGGATKEMDEVVNAIALAWVPTRI